MLTHGAGRAIKHLPLLFWFGRMPSDSERLIESELLAGGGVARRVEGALGGGGRHLSPQNRLERKKSKIKIKIKRAGLR